MKKEEHLAVIQQVLAYMNEQRNSPFILKGGTALSLCYSLNRFSEDIDLDAPSPVASSGRFKDEIQRICAKNGFSYRISKDMPTTQRVYLNYGDDAHPLKVEVSYRRKTIPAELVCVKNSIQVYTIDEMARLKAAAYSGRDKIRDLYDVSFICTHYYDELGESARDALRTALEYKDLEQFDYIIQTQQDELIDPDVLETMFLESFDLLGLLSPLAEKELEERGGNDLSPSSLQDMSKAMRAASDALDDTGIRSDAYHENGLDDSYTRGED